MFPQIGKIYALVMGNSMESCKEDVKRMTMLLSKYNGNIKTRIDCNTYNEIVYFCNSNIFNENDLLIIHYSGHGKNIGKKINNKMEILSAWVNNDKSLTCSYSIDIILSKVNCSKILISDSCHSGNFSNFYKGSFPLLFIGSSSIVSLSNEYTIFHKEKTGVLVCLWEYILSKKSLQELTLSDFKETTNYFFNQHKVRVKPVIKTYNLLK